MQASVELGEPPSGPADALFSAEAAAGPPRHARPAAATFVDSASATAILVPTSLLPRVMDAELDARPLPPVLDADSWDDEPPEPISTRGQRRNRLPLRIWLVVGLVLLGLGAAAIVPQLLSPGKDREPTAGPFTDPDSDAPPATSGGELIQPASAGGVTPSTATTRPGSTAAKPPGPTAGSPLTSTGGAPPPGAPFSLTLSAVDTHSYASWQRQDSICGTVILVGAWGSPRPVNSPPGTLTFSNITVPATGSYHVVITYAITTGGNRTATMTLNGTNVNTGGSFSPACTGSRTVAANFTKTTGNTIMFSNSTSTAPSIMRITISKP